MRSYVAKRLLSIAGFKTREEWSGDLARRLKTTDAP